MNLLLGDPGAGHPPMRRHRNALRHHRGETFTPQNHRARPHGRYLPGTLAGQRQPGTDIDCRNRTSRAAGAAVRCPGGAVDRRGHRDDALRGGAVQRRLLVRRGLLAGHRPLSPGPGLPRSTSDRPGSGRAAGHQRTRFIVRPEVAGRAGHCLLFVVHTGTALLPGRAVRAVRRGPCARTAASTLSATRCTSTC